MDYQSIFKRFEIKYILTDEQKAKITELIVNRMLPDKFPHSSIRNLYFDTDSFLLIRRSIEKPVYKEKLRLRSYGKVDSLTPVFMEIKKKYKSTVYKRRLMTTEENALLWSDNRSVPPDCQIGHEIDYMLKRYQGLKPKMFLSYERDSFRSETNSDLRITFDNNIMASTDGLSLSESPHGISLLPDGLSLMEIKCGGGMPLWLSCALSELKLNKVSFSKYGAAYKQMILGKNKGEYNYERHNLLGTF